MKKNCPAFLLLACLFGLYGVVLGQSDETVGDMAPFGKEAKFFGYTMSGAVFVRRDCSGMASQLGPDDKCLVINSATNTLNFDARDLGRRTFPLKTFENIIYLLSRHQYSYYFHNVTTLNKSGRLYYRPYFTLESDALSDPGLINPQTGLPFDGKVDLSLAGGRSLVKTLFPNYQESDNVAYGSPSISGLTKQFFMTNYGLSQQVVDDMFYGKITIRLNISGATANVEEGVFYYSVRFTGN